MYREADSGSGEAQTLATGWMQDMLPTFGSFDGDNVLFDSLEETLRDGGEQTLADAVDGFVSAWETVPIIAEAAVGGAFLAYEYFARGVDNPGSVSGPVHEEGSVRIDLSDVPASGNPEDAIGLEFIKLGLQRELIDDPAEAESPSEPVNVQIASLVDGYTPDVLVVQEYDRWFFAGNRRSRPIVRGRRRWQPRRWGG